jgi:hypothetical protein
MAKHFDRDVQNKTHEDKIKRDGDVTPSTHFLVSPTEMPFGKLVLRLHMKFTRIFL